jgi:hypothetical protein
VKLCSSEGCTNQAQKGGVCVRHGAKVIRCSNEGCTNQAKKGGVCMRHGAYRNSNDESTAFALSASAFERTTATLPHHSTTLAATSASQGTNIPDVVTIVCGVVATAVEEV